ncbi:MAG TPA: MlaD family protein [Cyclobacteriaceae bacterium]|jgi:phospholipid/cholesterol/gamma-HCH transport system substrate-binding protein|nr:MCE family protein [Cytophagales bacterium]HMR56688.1 MlaD family protein [Cyclobacteriaceae bacterium]HNT49736.1 MlaD family protein [Cyclobacteriaceae bacterium]HRE68045.1 MlaD family protein [Cyclobacteriaceae bacterium]HRF35146.1 MlaD family protein [Cyclobacteriaceae bacterium]
MVKNKEFKVGLFATVALVLLYFGFNFLKGIDFFSTTNKYYVVYDNIDQLAASNPVLINGFAVGRVSRIAIMQNRQNKVLVELTIDSEIALSDSTKAILNSDFLGGKSILLSIGKGTRTLNPKDTLLAEVAKGMLDVLSETATPVADNLQTTLRKFNVILDNLTKNSQQLDAIFVKLQATPDLLNSTLLNTNEKVSELSNSFKSVADNLNGSLTELKPTLANFKTFSDSLKRMELNQTVAEAKKTVVKLNETLDKIKGGDGTLGKLLTEDSLYVNLNTLLRNLDSLAAHFDSNPKHFLAPLGKSKRKIERDKRKEEEEKAKQK